MKILKAKEGYIFTQSDDVSVEERMFSGTIYLADNDSESNYKEITIEEYEVMRVEQEEYFKTQIEEHGKD